MLNKRLSVLLVALFAVGCGKGIEGTYQGPETSNLGQSSNATISITQNDNTGNLSYSSTLVSFSGPATLSDRNVSFSGLPATLSQTNGLMTGLNGTQQGWGNQNQPLNNTQNQQVQLQVSGNFAINEKSMTGSFSGVSMNNNTYGMNGLNGMNGINGMNGGNYSFSVNATKKND